MLELDKERACTSADQKRNLRNGNRFFFLLKCSSSISFGVVKHSGVTINNKLSLAGIEFGLPLK